MAFIGFLHFKTNRFLEGNVSGVDVVIYDERASLDDALIYALGRELPLLSGSPPTLFEGIELLEDTDSQNSGKLSYRKVTIDGYGDWLSEWQKCSDCIFPNGVDGESRKLPCKSTFKFSMEEGPLTWESVSPLLDVGRKKDFIKESNLKFSLMPEQEVAQVWSQVLYRWFDAQYSNCTMTIGDVVGAQCGPSKKYHGDAPHGSETRSGMDPLHLTISYASNCECGETEEDQL